MPMRPLLFCVLSALWWMLFLTDTWPAQGSDLCFSLQPAAVRNTPLFLRYLTTELHRQVPGGLVLWYDSVLQSGKLKWQDELNEHNR